MKKIILAIIGMSFLLTGCSDNKKEVTLKMDEEYKIEDDLSVTLTNVSTEKQIIPHNTTQEEFDVQYTTEDKWIYVDIQLKVKNISKETIQLNDEIDCLPAVEEKEVSKDYISLFFEEKPYSKLNDSAQLKADGEGILHMAFIINEKDIQSTMTCTATYKNTILIIDMEQYLNKNEFKKGDTLSSMQSNYDITFEDIYMYKTIDPSNTEGEYFYSTPRISTNGFLIAEVVIKNNSETDLTQAMIPDIIFNVDGEYDGSFVQQETSKGNDFEEDVLIPKKSSKKLYYSVEKEPSILAKDIVCQARIDGKTYFFNLKY